MTAQYDTRMFLTLFSNCLPQPTVLRVWDLIFLEGNEILLRTSLAIWQILADRIMNVRSADEFYCIMGTLTRDILEYDLIDANTLIKGIVLVAPLTELQALRDHYLYNINPWVSSLPISQKNTDKRLKPYRKDKLILDIGVLKKQYVKLKQRQRQAHIIFNTALERQTSKPAPVAMNHLLLGKTALVSSKKIGPPKGSIPPIRQTPVRQINSSVSERNESSSTSSSDTELCDEPDDLSECDNEIDIKSQDNITQDNLIQLNDSKNMSDDNTFDVSNVNDESNPKLIVNLAATNDDPPNEDIPQEVNVNNDLVDFSKPHIERSSSLQSDDGFDFEKFLEERVKCFNPTDHVNDKEDEKSASKRVTGARRNSIKALEIIQENSLILHRILQCQPRLSFSPPLINQETENATALYELDSKKQKTLDDANASIMDSDDESSISHLFEEKCYLNKDLDTIENSVLLLDSSSNYLKFAETISSNGLNTYNNSNEISTIDLQNRLISVLEKINECSSIQETMRDDMSRYNSNQTSSAACMSLNDSNVPEIKLDETLDSNKEEQAFENEATFLNDDFIQIASDSKYSSILEYSRNLDEKFNNLILKNGSLKGFVKTKSFEATDGIDKITEPKLSHSFTDFVNEPSEENRDKSKIDLKDHCLLKFKESETANKSITTDYNKESINFTSDMPKDTSTEQYENLVDSKDVTYNFDFPDITQCFEKKDMQPIKYNILPCKDVDAISISPDRNPLMPDFCVTNLQSLENSKSGGLLNLDTLGETPALKSPNRIYNPFPVNVSTRQNKELGLRLGLYKK